MNSSNHPIGIIDSGIGGFTVARSIQKALPQEDILYLGDGAHAPYGNRTSEELVSLAKYMVHFMREQGVKLLLVACNTISCLSSFYEEEVGCPVLYVVKSGAKGVAHLDYEKIGVISTNFTHQKGVYAQYIQEISPKKQVFSQGSTHLVRFIEEDTGDKHSPQSNQAAIKEEAKKVLEPLVEQGIECCVLGCTHYPLALDVLQETYPQLVFSDPAEEMAREAQSLLEEKGWHNPSGGGLTVYTTGDVAQQKAHLKRVSLKNVTGVHHLTPLNLQ